MQLHFWGKKENDSCQQILDFAKLFLRNIFFLFSPLQMRDFRSEKLSFFIRKVCMLALNKSRRHKITNNNCGRSQNQTCKIAIAIRFKKANDLSTLLPAPQRFFLNDLFHLLHIIFFFTIKHLLGTVLKLCHDLKSRRVPFRQYLRSLENVLSPWRKLSTSSFWVKICNSLKWDIY